MHNKYSICEPLILSYYNCQDSIWIEGTSLYSLYKFKQMHFPISKIQAWQYCVVTSISKSIQLATNRPVQYCQILRKRKRVQKIDNQQSCIIVHMHWQVTNTQWQHGLWNNAFKPTFSSPNLQELKYKFNMDHQVISQNLIVYPRHLIFNHQRVWWTMLVGKHQYRENKQL